MVPPTESIYNVGFANTVRSVLGTFLCSLYVLD